GLVRLWSLKNPDKPVRVYRHEHTVDGVAFVPDSRLIVTATRTGEVRFLDGLSGLPIGPILKHDNQVNSLDISPDKARLLTTSKDHTARVWKIPYVTESGTPNEIAAAIEDIVHLQIDESGTVRSTK
ncbi:hypothetical protein OAH18_03500, partial [bacterium]|nr:hypothetical protein [bacterium]